MRSHRWEHPIFLICAVPEFFLSITTENPGCNHSPGLWQDWQERCHWEDPGGKQGHRGRAETLVRHAGQPPPPHRPVASTAARGGGGCCRRSHKCQEVNCHQTTSPRPHSYISHRLSGAHIWVYIPKSAPWLYIRSPRPPFSLPSATSQKSIHPTWWENIVYTKHHVIGVQIIGKKRRRRKPSGMDWYSVDLL